MLIYSRYNLQCSAVCVKTKCCTTYVLFAFKTVCSKTDYNGVTAVSHYAINLVKILQLIWRSGTRRFHLQVPDLHMSRSDLTRMRGYQDSSSNNLHQATFPIWPSQASHSSTLKSSRDLASKQRNRLVNIELCPLITYHHYINSH